MMAYIPIQVQRVLELKGAYADFNCPSSVYAHISNPVKKDGLNVQYAMLAIFPQHGIMHLGDINPKTKMFEHYDTEMPTLALYKRASNHVVNQVSVHIEQIKRLKTLEEVLSINGISIKRELIPE